VALHGGLHLLAGGIDALLSVMLMEFGAMERSHGGSVLLNAAKVGFLAASDVIQGDTARFVEKGVGSLVAIVALWGANDQGVRAVVAARHASGLTPRLFEASDRANGADVDARVRSLSMCVGHSGAILVTPFGLVGSCDAKVARCLAEVAELPIGHSPSGAEAIEAAADDVERGVDGLDLVCLHVSHATATRSAARDSAFEPAAVKKRAVRRPPWLRFPSAMWRATKLTAAPTWSPRSRSWLRVRRTRGAAREMAEMAFSRTTKG
jgi:hypothetical protein